MTAKNPKILTINNKEEEKFLRRKVADFDFSKFKKNEIDDLIKKMRSTMIKASGIGLSANQIGLNLNFFVARLPKIENEKIISWKFYAIFNPKIAKISEKKSIMEEGCLSVPKIYGQVERPEKITLACQDRYEKKIAIKATDLLAKIFQHETDHLNGILFIDKAKNINKLKNSAEKI